MSFQYLTTDDGLSYNRIYAIYRDSKDYLWIGTTNSGLNRYDGKNITVFKNIDDQPGSISNDGIQCIYEDSENNLWIGTTDGLNLYDPKSESFIIFRHDSTHKSGYYGNYVTGITEDLNGNIWITFDQGVGLAKWDDKNNCFIRVRIQDPNNDYDVNSMTSIATDSQGAIWMATRGPGISKFDPETGDFIFYNDSAIEFGEENTRILCIDHSDKIWIGSMDNGLFSFDPASGKFKHFKSNIGNKGPNSHIVLSIIQTDNRHLLIGTDQGGINRYDMVSNTFEYIVKDEKIANGLNNNGILCLHQDKEGILWVGTTRGGVNYFNPKEHKFKLYKHNTNNPNSLSYNIVGCFHEDSKGLIWIGTDGGGVNVYDPGTGDFTIYKHDPADPYSVSGDVIRCIDEDKDGDIWIGTWDAGLNRYDKKEGRFYHYFHDTKDPSSISNNSIWHLYIDHKDNIWLAGYLQGVEIFNKQKGVIRRFSANQDGTGTLSNDNVRFIYEDRQQNIWICTFDGINLYDPKTNSFTVYKNFPDNNIVAFCRDAEGKLWAGSHGKGLYVFEQDGTIAKIYNTKSGLPDNMVHSIVEDDNGNLWVSTNDGISHFNQKTGKFRNYYRNDGLQGNVFFEQSFLKTGNGEIYFGGYNGFNSFHPDSLRDNSYIPKVYITGFKLFNKPVPFGVPGSPLQHHISETKEITLSWRESVFSFEFTAINYTHPEKNQFAYKMEGFENEWNYVGDITNATYTNLEPGEYIFRVKASNNDGIWNEEGTSVTIIITPPFWKTLWFRGLATILILFFIILGFRLRVRNIKKRSEELEYLVKKRTEQLRVANKELEAFAYSVSHDLRTPLRGITGFSNILQEDYQHITDEQKLNYLNRIGSAAQRMVQIIDDMLDLSKLKHSKINILDIDLSNMAREILHELHKSQPDRNVVITIAEGMTVKADRRLIRIALENMIGNAWKYTSKRPKAIIEIGQQVQKNKTVYFVRDNGVGFDMKYAKKMFEAFQRGHAATEFPGSGIGLATVQRIIKRHGGEVWAQGETGKGAAFYFTLS